MKKLSKICLVLVLALTLALVFAACDNNASTVSEDEGGTDIETTYYTVKFVTNGDIELAQSTFKYASTEKIVKPTTEPVKKGYTFKYWSADSGSTAFDFENYNFEEHDVSDTLTITAYYTNNVYQHEVNTTAKLGRNVDGSGNVTYSIDPDYYDAGQYPSGNIALSSTYNQTSSLTVPSTTADDKFCFYYFLDEEMKPVQFTYLWDGSSSTVTMMSSYQFTTPLTIYAMWESNLKEIAGVTLKYDYRVIDDAGNFYQEAKEVKHLTRDNVFATEAELTETGYALKGFTYTIGEDDEAETSNFVFATKTGTGTDEKITAGTSLLDILEDAYDDYSVFTPYTIELSSIWLKEVLVTNLASYKANLYSVMQGTNEFAKKELQYATITITADIDLNAEEYYPLFDKDHVFKGIIKSETEGTQISITNGTIKGYDSISFLGYIDGKVSDIIIDDLQIKLETKESKYADTILIGTLATNNAGYINHCAAAMTSIIIEGTAEAPLTNVLFGGLVAINNGIASEDNEDDTTIVITSDERGRIYQSSVNISLVTIKAEQVELGGLVGEAGTLSRIVSSEINLVDAQVSVESDSDASNGSPIFKFGGVTAINGGKIVSTTVTAQLTNTTIASDAYVGGMIGANTGIIEKSYSQGSLTLTSAGTSQNIGGLIGLSEGKISDSYSTVSLNVIVASDNAISNVGGLVGSNFSDKTADSSVVGIITDAYSKSTIAVNCNSHENVTVNVGGIAGKNIYSNSDCFAVNDITVSNLGTTNAGYIYGSGNIEGTITNMWRSYATDKPIMVNGNAQAEKTSIPEWEQLTNLTNFSSEVWFFGDSDQGGHISLNSDVWEFNAGELILK